MNAYVTELGCRVTETAESIALESERRALLDEARATAALLRPSARVVAEFADVDDAVRFIHAQHSRYVITPGVHYSYAVRERRS